MQGGVYETNCNGVKLAWKRKYCRRKMDARERREIEIIKKLSHRHIIRLMGTYTHGPSLGLLLWPVATCDLATLLEDIEWLVLQTSFWNQVTSEPPEDRTEHEHDRKARLHALGIPTESQASSISPAATFLKQTIGCIAGAVAFLHASDIKHKDLKPSNILLSRDGLWLTDFGTATDFSVLTTSVSENGERGTPKYFAPEVASFAPSGRSADIFSLGCILFEIITLYMGHILQVSQKLRKSKDKSFQSNLGHIVTWFEEDLWIGSTAADDYLLGLVRWMMEEEEAARPTAEVVEEEIALMNGLGLTLCAKHARPRDSGVYRACCCIKKCVGRTTVLSALNFKATINVTHGTKYLMSRPRPVCTVYLQHTGESLVESVHIFVVSVFWVPPLSIRILSSTFSGPNSSEISPDH
jgi:serine/threonine protein kinase